MNGTYSIDLVKRTQVRPSTGKTRNIVRGTWFWFSDSASKVPYTEDLASKLEAAYQGVFGTEQTAKVTIDSQRFCVVTAKGTKQFNTSGNTAGRDVKRGFI